MTTPDEIQKLQRYYEINLNHARWSFWASLVSVAVGMVTLLFGVFMLYTHETPAAGTTATIAGLLSEFISATFFYLYNKNLKQLNYFYEKLIKFQDTYWAMGLVQKLPNEKQPEVWVTIISNLLMRNEPKSEMSPELVRAYAEAMQKGT
ncbi:TRADD-N-associated membrane domain-containing protein [Porticoccus sp.]